MEFSWLKEGVKCVFVDDTPGLNPFPVSKKGDVCRVLAVSHINGFVVLRAEEINGRWRHGTNEWAKAHRFRPLITEADDIALFKSLLNPTLVDKLDLLAERMNELAEDLDSTR